MLKTKVVKESFVACKVKGMATANIGVYIIPGRQAQKLLDGQMRIKMSHGVKDPKEIEFNEESPQEAQNPIHQEVIV